MPYTEGGPEDEKKSTEQKVDKAMDTLTDSEKGELPLDKSQDKATEENDSLGEKLFVDYMKALTFPEDTPEENHPMIDFLNNIDPNNLNIKEIYNKLQTNNLFSAVNINFLLPKSRTPDSNTMFFKIKSTLDNKNFEDFSTAFEDIIPYIKDYINDMKPSSEKDKFQKKIISSDDLTYSEVAKFLQNMINDGTVNIVSTSTPISNENPDGLGRDTKDLGEISTKSKEQILANQEENLIAQEKDNNTLSRVFFSKLFFTESGNKGSQMNILDSFSNNIFKNNKLVENIANMNKLYSSLGGNIDKFENITPIDLTNPENFINAIRTLKEQISEDQLTNLLIGIDSDEYNNDPDIKVLLTTIITELTPVTYAKNRTNIIKHITSGNINNLINFFPHNDKFSNLISQINNWVAYKKKSLLKDHKLPSEDTIAQN